MSKRFWIARNKFGMNRYVVVEEKNGPPEKQKWSDGDITFLESGGAYLCREQFSPVLDKAARLRPGQGPILVEVPTITRVVEDKS